MAKLVDMYARILKLSPDVRERLKIDFSDLYKAALGASAVVHSAFLHPDQLIDLSDKERRDVAHEVNDTIKALVLQILLERGHRHECVIDAEELEEKFGDLFSFGFTDGEELVSQ